MLIENSPSHGPFSNSVFYSEGLRLRIFGSYNQYPAANYVNQKYNLIKYQPSMRLIEGLHFMHGHQLASFQCAIMHFKYHAQFHEKVIREIASGQHWNGATEYKRYAKKLSKDAESILFDSATSKKYTSSKDLFEQGLG